MLTDLLHVLLGAALVSIGVLASAAADRIRGLRISRETGPRRAIPVVVEPAERETPAVKAPPRAPRAEPRARPSAGSEGGDEVISALVAAGYKKPVATDATWACSAAERVTIESWVASALRRCARGAMS